MARVYRLLLLSLFALAAVAGDEARFQITFDIYFENQLLGDAVAEVDELGDIKALDSSLIIEKLPALLTQIGINDHPLQKAAVAPAMTEIGHWPSRYAVIPRVDPATFRIRLELPPLYKPIKRISLQPRDEQKKSTIAAAKYSGWTLLSGIVSPMAAENAHTLGWRGGVSIEDWHLLANGGFGGTAEPFDRWRVERNFWGSRIDRFQVGWLNVPLIINGQHTPGGAFGLAVSNSLNRILTSDVLEQLPGGILELNEPSKIEVFRDGLLIQTLQLDGGRYRIGDIILSDGLNFIDVRITTQSGRIVTRRLSIESFPQQPPKGEIEYSLFAGADRQPNADLAPTVGFTIYRGFGSGFSMGMHTTWTGSDGYRLGMYLEQYIRAHRLDFWGWWQQREKSDQLGQLQIDLALSKIFFNLSAKALFNIYTESAQGISRTHEISAGFNPQILGVELFRADAGFVRRLDSKSGYFFRLARSFILGEGINITASLSADTLQPSIEAVISFSVAPIPAVSFQHSQSFGPSAANRFNAGIEVPDRDLRFLVDYASMSLQNQQQINAFADWNTDFVKLRSTGIWGTDKKNVFSQSQISLAYETGFVFADGSFAITSNASDTFAIVDASRVQFPSQVKVSGNGRNVNGWNGHYGVGNLAPFRANHLQIDASNVGFGYATRDEFLNPSPGQAFKVKVERRTILMASGTLYLPDGKPLPMVYGQLTHKETGDSAEWFTGDEGLFVFEGRPGFWSGTVYWEGSRYLLQFNLREEDAIEQAIYLGDIHLKRLP